MLSDNFFIVAIIGVEELYQCMFCISKTILRDLFRVVKQRFNFYKHIFILF